MGSQRVVLDGFDGMYEIDQSGAVWSRYSGKMLKPRKGTNGYLSYHLYVGGVGKNYEVHYLVALTFIGPRPDSEYVCHIDGNKMNNHVKNLRYGTPTSNNLDKRSHGTDHNLNKKECPRGHLLVEPNLSKGNLKQGTRTCLACHRAKSYMRYRGIGGEMIKEISDKYYKDLMEDSGA